MKFTLSILRHKAQLVLSLGLIVLIGTVVVTPSWAQQEISDYNFQYEQYRNLYPQYETARNEYLQYQTLTSQQEAVVKTKDVLWQRAQTLRTYFFALRYKINTIEGVDLSERSRFSASLDDQIGWLQNHLDDLKGLNNPALSQLFEISDRFERKEREFRILGHQALATILIGKVRNLHQQTTTINSQLATYVALANNAQYLRNWLDEAQSNALKAVQGLRRAEASLSEFERNGGDLTQTQQIFAIIQAEVTTSQRLLFKGSGFQQEIIRDLQKFLPRQESTPSDSKVTTPAQSASPSGMSNPTLIQPAQASSSSSDFIENPYVQ